MGLNISDIVEKQKKNLEDFKDKVIAIDAHNTIYQFLASIRTEDGSPLADLHGRPVSHLSGLLSRNANLVHVGIKPVYVFDGKPPELKKRVLKERRERKEKAAEEYKEALKEGDLERARTKAQQTSRITDDIIESGKELLGYLGIPVVQAPSEGEAQASFMAAKGDVWAAASQDFDSLLFGTPRLVRNMTLSGRRKLPRQNRYVTVEPEEIDLEEVLKQLGLTRDQLIDLGILIGTDYNEGIKGIGPKTALKLIRKHGDLKKVMAEQSLEIESFEEIQELFKNPPTISGYGLEWKNVDEAGVKKLLCDTHGFSEDRVNRWLEKFAEFKKARSQMTLDQW
jgi:flap endonuclease-1